MRYIGLYLIYNGVLMSCLRLLSRDGAWTSDDFGLLDYGVSGDDCAASRQSCMQQVVLGSSHFLGGQYGIYRADAAEI